MIQGIDHIVLTVSDLERTLAFYPRVLGMACVREPGRPAALGFGSQKINVHQKDHRFEPKAFRPTPGSSDFCLITDRPVADWLALLRHHGVALELGPVVRSGARGPMDSIYFRDPDNNLIEVTGYH
jgi:catechol 2,3-dioxygenase-like lactoylglutathione lyase family enzyme